MPVPLPILLFRPTTRFPLFLGLTLSLGLFGLLHLLQFPPYGRVILHCLDSCQFLLFDEEHRVLPNLGSGIPSGICVLYSDKILVHVANLTASAFSRCWSKRSVNLHSYRLGREPRPPVSYPTDNPPSPSHPTSLRLTLHPHWMAQHRSNRAFRPSSSRWIVPVNAAIRPVVFPLPALYGVEPTSSFPH